MAIIEKHICTCGNCEINSVKSILVGKGNVSRYELINNEKKTISKYIVDDCLLLSRGREEKCDYIFTVKEIQSIYFVECKGSDVLKAVNQLGSTLNILSKEVDGLVLKGRIVASRVYSPDLRTIQYKKLRAKLNGQLETRNKLFQDYI